MASDNFTIQELSGNYPGTIRDFGGWLAGLWLGCAGVALGVALGVAREVAWGAGGWLGRWPG